MSCERTLPRGVVRRFLLLPRDVGGVGSGPSASSSTTQLASAASTSTPTPSAPDLASSRLPPSLPSVPPPPPPASYGSTSNMSYADPRVKHLNVLVHGTWQLLLGDVHTGLSRFQPLWAFLAVEVAGLGPPQLLGMGLATRGSAGPADAAGVGGGGTGTGVATCGSDGSKGGSWGGAGAGQSGLAGGEEARLEAGVKGQGAVRRRRASWEAAVVAGVGAREPAGGGGGDGGAPLPAVAHIDEVPPAARPGMLGVAAAFLPYYVMDEHFGDMARAFPSPVGGMSGVFTRWWKQVERRATVQELSKGGAVWQGV